MLNTWLFWSILSAIFAALTTIFAKVGIEQIDSDFGTLIRTIIIVLILSLFVIFQGKWINPFTLSLKSMVFLSLSAVTTGISWLCYFKALQMGNAYQVATVDKFSLVLVVIFAYLFLAERLSMLELLGIGLTAVGVILLAINHSQT
jgi:bacterial/archaeal transporter family protein